MLCKYTLRLDALAGRIEAAVEQVLAQGYRTRDIQSSGTTLVGTAEMGTLVLQALG
jgi:3-isopropylmalate dehydrogenase